MDVHLPLPDSPTTPPASLSCVTADTPMSPLPLKGKRVSFMARVLFHALEEICQTILDENREWERSEEAQEVQRKRKLRVLIASVYAWLDVFSLLLKSANQIRLLNDDITTITKSFMEQSTKWKGLSSYCSEELDYVKFERRNYDQALH
ncbi:hypothetical protein VNO77_42330 [Canavalia gladiata]|uniref:Uncharacterized protein n=1 Tax=Canavalia gladiata TaxID=3824 RepID=A0AAN9PQX4_CANGL